MVAPRAVKLGKIAGLQLAAVVFFLLLPSLASARIDGIASTSCGGCHGSGGATVTLDVPSVSINPGDQVVLTVTIEGSNTQGGGFYISSGAEGTFQTIGGQVTKINGTGVSHSARKDDVGGVVTFQVNWTAPDTPGATHFMVAGVSANANGARSGDESGSANADIVYGCDPITVYRDYDQDGYGTDLFTQLDCAASAQWADKDGDCNESKAAVNPGAEEVCNLIDDNCDTEIDEGLQNITVYLDEDGDGHGVPTTTALGCGANPGYASLDDDCDDADALAYPGAQELCNLRDDDCDDAIDENAVIECGIGECKRSAESCFISECIPGVPVPELCNGLDDDCDVYIDEGEGLCPPGQMCTNAECVEDPNYVPGADAGAQGSGGEGNEPTDPGVGAQSNGGSGPDDPDNGQGGDAVAAGGEGAEPGAGGEGSETAGAAGQGGGQTASRKSGSGGCGFARTPAGGLGGALGLLFAATLLRRRRPRERRAR